MKNTLRITVLALATFWIAGPAWSQQQAAGQPGPNTREWTSLDGTKITADYLGVQGESTVVLKLANGKISFVPLAKLSVNDNFFVGHNRIGYYPPWRGWPRDAGLSSAGLSVNEVHAESGSFIYTTQHFRFDCDVNLGTQLMKDLARVFELTYDLDSKSPFGILAKPRSQWFEAKLLGTLGDYIKAGGRPNSAGIYLIKDKVFMAPLQLMGVRAGSAGWRKESEIYDPSTIVHELTHMLTHDMLVNLPTWMNEGYAEYISNIPIENKEFKTSGEKIREGVRDMFVRQHEMEHTSPGRKLNKLDKAARIAYLKSDSLPALFKVEKVLRMSNEEWATGRKPQPPVIAAAPTRKSTPEPVVPGGITIHETAPIVVTGTRIMPISEPVDPNRMPRLYHTAHLIIYYFIQLEGEKGVVKLQRFLDENRSNLARCRKFEEDFKTYERDMADFMKRPGVTNLGDGRFRYPANLQPPKAPQPPFTDPNMLTLGGLPMLLGGETAAGAAVAGTGRGAGEGAELHPAKTTTAAARVVASGRTPRFSQSAATPQ